MELIHHQQRAPATDLGQMQLRRSRNGLVGRDVPGQAPARVGLVLSRANCQIVVECAAPVRVGEGLLGLKPQAVARHHPAHPLDNAGPDEMGAGDHGQKRLAPARCHGREHVGDAGRLSGCECGHEAEHLTLMRAQRASSEGHAVRFRRRYLPDQLDRDADRAGDLGLPPIRRKRRCTPLLGQSQAGPIAE